MGTRIRPPVRGFGPVAPGGGAAVGAALQDVGQALGAFGELQTNRELLDIRAQAQADVLQARQVEKMERSEAIAQFTAKQIVRNEQASRIVTEAREARDFSRVQEDMDRWETESNQTIFEGRSQQFKDIFEVMDRSARVGSINKLSTAVEAGTLRIIADNYQISVDNLVESVNEFSDPAEINEQFDEMDEVGANMGITQASIKSTSGQSRREAMEKYVRSLALVDGLAALSDPDVASALGNKGREVMRRELTSSIKSLQANMAVSNRVTELKTGINVVQQFNRGASESELNTMIRQQEAVSPAAEKDALNLVEALSLARARGPQPISADKLRTNHVFSENLVNALLDERKAILEDEDLEEDEKRDALFEIMSRGTSVLAEASRLSAQGQFNESNLTELAFQAIPLSEDVSLFEQEEKGLFEKFLIALPGGAPLGGGGDKRIPDAIVAGVRREMFLGQGRYGGLSPAQRSVMGRILTAVAIETEGSSQPMSTEEAIALAQGIFDRSGSRFASSEFNLVGENAEQIRDILFKDGSPATEPRQQPRISVLADIIRSGFDQGMTEDEIRNNARQFAGFSDEAFDRAVAAVDRATAEAPALSERR